MQRCNCVELIFWCLRGIVLSCNCSLVCTRQLSRHHWAVQKGSQWDSYSSSRNGINPHEPGEGTFSCSPWRAADKSLSRLWFPGAFSRQRYPNRFFFSLFFFSYNFPPIPLEKSGPVFSPTRDLPEFRKILHPIKKPFTSSPSIPLQTPWCNSCHPLVFCITDKFVSLSFYPVVGGQWPSSKWKFKHRKHPMGQHSDCIRYDGGMCEFLF